MKTLHKKSFRWSGAFRGLNPADSLLLYAGSTPRAGSALWHSHPRNHVPHVHVEAAKADADSGHELHRHRASNEQQHHTGHTAGDHETGRGHSHEHNHSDDSGHWHLVVPAELLRVWHQFLVFAACEIWDAICDLADVAIEFRSASSARGPPLSISTF
jgi:hypothetical protein